ncbi:hypothetical protein PQR70_33635 [Paraburkholderia madseniana]|uniref:hypothetical protein n=1 Tax=Paraburkholderia madseniana TaxID=2599607 RepID=UPI0038BBFD48
MFVYFDNNVLVDLVRSDVDPVSALAGSQFVIAVTPDLAAEYQQAIGNEKVSRAERELCVRLLSISVEAGIFGFGEAGSGYSGFDHGGFASEEQIRLIASTPVSEKPGRAIPKHRTDAFLAALASGAIVVTNDTGGHWKRAKAAGYHVYRWAELSVPGAAPSELAASLTQALIRSK